MTVMGEEPPDVWMDEWRRRGRVVFPARRRPVLIRLACVVVVGSLNPLLSFGEWLEEGGTRLLFGLISMSLWAVFAGLSVWQLVSGRPAVIVDDEGIRIGRKRFMPWTELGTIGIPGGPAPFMTVPLIPNDVWAKHLAVPRDNVKDLPALATWLTEVLEERHRSATT
jgi:hypothetical protein